MGRGNSKPEARNGESPSDVINQKRLERSEAVERLEHLERASVCVRAAFLPRKNALQASIYSAIYTIFYRLINRLR